MTLRTGAYAFIFLSFLYAMLHVFYEDVQASSTYTLEVESVYVEETPKVQIESERLRLQTYELMEMIKRAERSCEGVKESCTQLADF